MKFAPTISFLLLLSAAAPVFAGSAAVPAPATRQKSAATAEEANQKWMVEGATRFRVNCGRCHQAPSNFSPRVMAMAVRHMRVRAILTEQDTKYLLYYLSH
jgi:cytochrome c5